MTSKHMNQTIVLNDGRKLGFAEYGDPTGKVVFHFHGGAGSRLERPANMSILTDLKVRLISTDRPGHGLSDFQPNRQLLDWPNDINQLADTLNINKFFVMGWSAGGPHALACAYKLADRLHAVAIVSSLAPPNRPNPYAGVPFPNRVLMFLFRRVPKFAYLFRRMGYSSIKGDPGSVGKKLASSSTHVDRKIIGMLENQKIFVEDIQEGYRQGWQGPALDDIITFKSWGFSLKDITSRVDIWQGEMDQNVPHGQSLYLHGEIPNSRLTVLPDMGHLFLLSHWRDVLTALAE